MVQLILAHQNQQLMFQDFCQLSNTLLKIKLHKYINYIKNKVSRHLLEATVMPLMFPVTTW